MVQSPAQHTPGLVVRAWNPSPWEAKKDKCKGTFGYKMSSRTAWATWDPIQKSKRYFPFPRSPPPPPAECTEEEEVEEERKEELVEEKEEDKKEGEEEEGRGAILSCPENSFDGAVIHYLCFLKFLPPLLRWHLDLGRMGCDLDVPIRADYWRLLFCPC